MEYRTNFGSPVALSEQFVLRYVFFFLFTPGVQRQIKAHSSASFSKLFGNLHWRLTLCVQKIRLLFRRFLCIDKDFDSASQPAIAGPLSGRERTVSLAAILASTVNDASQRALRK